MCALSNPFPSKPSIIFSAQKPLYSLPNYTSTHAWLPHICFLFSGFSNVYHSACVWPTALKLGCITNFDMLFLVTGFNSLVNGIQFMLISSRHICVRSVAVSFFWGGLFLFFPQHGPSFHDWSAARSCWWMSCGDRDNQVSGVHYKRRTVIIQSPMLLFIAYRKQPGSEATVDFCFNSWSLLVSSLLSFSLHFSPFLLSSLVSCLLSPLSSLLSPLSPVASCTPSFAYVRSKSSLSKITFRVVDLCWTLTQNRFKDTWQKSQGWPKQQAVR